MTKLVSVFSVVTLLLASACSRDTSLEISGTVGYLQRVALPPVAIARVYIVPIGSNGVPGVTVAEFVSQPPFTTPMPFTLKIDPKTVGSASRYQLRGEITVGQQLMFFGNQELETDPARWPSDVELIVNPTQ